MLRHGALVGRVFWRGAIAELDPELDVDAALDGPRRPAAADARADLRRHGRGRVPVPARPDPRRRVRRAREERPGDAPPDVRRVAPHPLARRPRGDAGVPPRACRDAPRRARRSRPRRPPRGGRVRPRAGGPAGARARGEPQGAQAAAALDRARAEPHPPLLRRTGGMAAVGAPGGRRRDGGRARAGARGGRPDDRGSRARADRGDRAEPECGRRAGATLGARGARASRRRPGRRPVGGADAALERRLVGGRPRRASSGTRATRSISPARPARPDLESLALVRARRSPPPAARARKGRGGPGGGGRARGVERQPLGGRVGRPGSAARSCSGRGVSTRLRTRSGRRERALRRDRRRLRRRADAAARRASPSGRAAIPIARSRSSARPCARCSRSRSGRRSSRRNGRSPRSARGEGARRGGRALGAVGARDRRYAGHDVALERAHGARARSGRSGAGRRGRARSCARRSTCWPRPSTATSSPSLSPRYARFLRERGRDDEAARDRGPAGRELLQPESAARII